MINSGPTDYFFWNKTIFHLKAIFHERHPQAAKVIYTRLSHSPEGEPRAAGQWVTVVRPLQRLKQKVQDAK